MKKTVYLLSIDIETSGPNVAKNDLLSFAGVITEYPSGKEVSHIKQYIKPLNGKGTSADITWNPSTLEFWNKNKEVKDAMLSSIDSEGVSSVEAMSTFAAWFKTIGKKCIVIFDTASFDASFFNYHLGLADISSMQSVDFVNGDYLHAFDTTSYHAGVARHRWDSEPFGKDMAAGKAVGIENIEAISPYKNSHDPVEDARNIAWTTTKISSNF